MAINVALSFFGVGGAFLAGGQGWGASIGMGAFVAFWGGLGFGGMIGGVVWATQVDEAAKRERLQASAPAPADVEAADQTSNTVRNIGGAVADGYPEPAAVKVAS